MHYLGFQAYFQARALHLAATSAWGSSLLSSSFTFSSFLLWHYWWVSFSLALLNGMEGKLWSISHYTALKRGRWCCCTYDGLVDFPLLSYPCTFLGMEQEEDLCPSYVPRLCGDCSLHVLIFMAAILEISPCGFYCRGKLLQMDWWRICVG